MVNLSARILLTCSFALFTLLLSREGRGFETFPSLFSNRPVVKGLNYVEERKDGSTLSCEAPFFSLNPFLANGRFEEPRITLHYPQPFKTREWELRAKKGRIDFSSRSLMLQGDVVLNLDEALTLKTDFLRFSFEKNVFSSYDKATVEHQGQLLEGRNLLLNLGEDRLTFFLPSPHRKDRRISFFVH